MPGAKSPRGVGVVVEEEIHHRVCVPSSPSIEVRLNPLIGAASVVCSECSPFDLGHDHMRTLQIDRWQSATTLQVWTPMTSCRIKRATTSTRPTTMTVRTVTHGCESRCRRITVTRGAAPSSSRGSPAVTPRARLSLPRTRAVLEND